MPGVTGMLRTQQIAKACRIEQQDISGLLPHFTSAILIPPVRRYSVMIEISMEIKRGLTSSQDKGHDCR